jgi:hypothetical protein
VVVGLVAEAELYQRLGGVSQRATPLALGAGQFGRDRLAARVQGHGRSLGGELSAMLDDLMWQGIEDGYRRLAADEAEFAAYRRETAEWIGADLGGLASTAAEDYPLHNS